MAGPFFVPAGTHACPGDQRRYSPRVRAMRLIPIAAGLLIALLATGTVRLAHMVTAHSGPSACADAVCGGCDHGPPDHSEPADDTHRGSSECPVCLLLAVLSADGLPVCAEPFFPASEPGHVRIAERAPKVPDGMRIPPARGPPALPLA